MSITTEKLEAACVEVAKNVSIRQSATETKGQFVLRLWRSVNLELRGATP